MEDDVAFSKRIVGFTIIVLSILLSACGSTAPQSAAAPTERPAPTPIPTSVPTITDEPAPLETVPTALPTPTPTPEPIVITADNVADVVQLQTLVGHTDDVTDVAFSPDGSLVATSSLDNSVRIWRVSDGSLLHVLEGHTHWVESVAFSPDGTQLASGADDRSVRIWQVDDGTLVRTISNDFMGRVLKVDFSPDGSLLAIAGHNCYVELRTTRSGILRRTLAQPHCVARRFGSVSYWGLAFSADGSRMITAEGRACCGGSIQEWETEEYVPAELLRGYDLVVRDLALSPDGDKLAVALVGTSYFWLFPLDQAWSPQTFEGHVFRVNSVDFSPDGQLLASGSRDSTVRLWREEDGEMLRVLEGHTDGVDSVSFSPDGSLIASASEDDSVIIWGLASR
jgi:WD40 repeat protein